MKRLLRAGLVLLLTPYQLPSAESDSSESGELNTAIVTNIVELVASGGGSLLRSDWKELELPETVMAWLRNHRAGVLSASPSPFQQARAWGVATSQKDKLYLFITNWPEKGQLQLPRLHNSVLAIQLNGHDKQLRLKPQVSYWEITLPAVPPAGLLPVVEVQLDGPPRAAHGKPPVVQATAQGRIILHARDAVTHGKMLRFEPQPHKNTVGYWTQQDDWAEWTFQVPRATEYEVVLRYGCGNEQGGSQIQLNIGEHTIPFTVEATGGFQAWREVNLGNIRLSQSDTQRCIIKPIRKARNAVMDVQQVTLLPIK